MSRRRAAAAAMSEAEDELWAERALAGAAVGIDNGRRTDATAALGGRPAECGYDCERTIGA